MTILHISAVKSWGGGENHIENLCYELSVSNPEVKNIILCTQGGAFHDRLINFSYNFVAAPLLFNLDFRYILKIIRLCKKEKVDIIHLHDPRAMALAIAADRLFELPPFIFSKKTSFPIKKRKQTLYKYNYYKIRKYLCVSMQTKNVLAKAVIDQEKLITIYHGTRIDNKSELTPFDLREKYNIPSDKKIVGSVANHHKSKNLETLIDVADYTINKRGNTKVCFVQIGTFTERTEMLMEKVKALSLEKHILFLGYTPKASNFIPQFDISLITSSNEGLPQVIYESFYHNVPVVSTNVAGIPEVITDKENGFLSDAYDFKGLGEQVLCLVENQNLAHKFTGLSREKLFEQYVTPVMAMRTLREYNLIAKSF